MNRENVLKVADAIEQHSIPDLGFNMGWFLKGGHVATDRSGHNCGTSACIAGWARRMRIGRRYPEASATIENFKWEREAAWLGLSRDQAYELFFAQDELYGTMNDYTPQQAGSVLRHLADTGEVDWSVADKVTT